MRIAALLLCATSLWAQAWPFPGPGLAPSCTTPAGTNFTESFGDGAISCGFGSYVGCDQFWESVTGTQSITSSPSGAPSGVCANSAQVVTAGAASYMRTAGSFQTIPSGTTFDLYTAVYIVSESLANSNTLRLVTPAASNTGGTNAASLILTKSGGQLALIGRGSNDSATAAISTGTWYEVRMHVESGAAASYISVNGGANKTFTANAQATAWMVLGANSSTVTATADIGYVKVDSAVSSSGDSALFTAETGSNGDALSTTNAAASTTAGNGAWSGTPTGWTISTTQNLAYTNPATVAGTSYDGSGTRSYRYDFSSNASSSVMYTAVSTSQQATQCFRFRTDVMPTGGTFASFNLIQNVVASDFVSMMLNDNQLYLETLTNTNGNPDVGSKYTWSANTTYSVCFQFNVGGPHKLWLWDSTCSNLLTYQEKAATPGATALPTRFTISRSDAAGAFTGKMYIDNDVINYKGGVTTPTCH